MSDYSKLTKNELIYALYARDMMLKDCRNRFQAHKETDCRTIQEQSDLIEILKTKLDEKQNELVEKTTQLKQQLEKLKSENHALISDNAYQEADMFEFNSRIEQLQKELTEKEKELENYKLCKCVNCTNEYEFMLEGLVEDLEKELDKADQDKISFAAEQLKFLKNEIEMIGHIPKYTVLPERELICRFDVFRLIDNQIKQLKEME